MRINWKDNSMLKSTIHWALLIACLTLLTQSMASAQITKQIVRAPDIVLYLYPTITSISPTQGDADTKVTIHGGKLSGVTQVLFGGLSAGFTIQDDYTIIAYAPLGAAPGSNVTVTAMSGGQLVPTSAVFTYPLGEMNVTGPEPFNPAYGGDPSWIKGDYHIASLSPPQLIISPVVPKLYIDAAFADSGLKRSTVPPLVLGTGGSFTAYLQMCSLGGTLPSNQVQPNPGQGGSCTNWDGNTGSWVYITPATTTKLSDAGPNLTTYGTVPIPISGLFDSQNYARTFRVDLSLNQFDATDNTASGYRIQNYPFSASFNVVHSPAGLIQLNVIPYTILYHPPGNQSTVSFTANNTYGTNLTLGNSNTVSNSTTWDNSSSVSFAETLAYTVGISLGNNGSWDQSSKQTFGTTNSTANATTSSLNISSTWSFRNDPALIPGSGATCANTACTQTTPDTGIYLQEPFWEDTFVLLVHPQFAVWVVGSGANEYAMYGAVPVTADVTVAELAACTSGAVPDACVVNYSDDELKAPNGSTIVYAGSANTVTLSASDASNLLKLDPFYGPGQGANIPATRGIPQASASYGASYQNKGIPGTAVARSLSNQTQATSTNTKQETNSSSITTTLGFTQSEGMTVGASGSGASLKESLTFTSGSKSAYESDMQTGYSDSTAVSNQQVTSAQVTLDDVDNTTIGNSGQFCKICHAPLPHLPTVNVYLDRLFGSFMFQDPSAPQQSNGLSLTAIQLATKLIAVISLQEQNKQRFSDVPIGSPSAVSIGLAARLHLLSGNPDKTFHPNDPLTSSQLSSALAAILKVPAAPTPPTTNTPASQPAPTGSTSRATAIAAVGLRPQVSVSATTLNASVSRVQMAVALAGALHLTGTPQAQLADSAQIAPASLASVNQVVAAGFMQKTANGAFNPSAIVTRAEAAQELTAAMESRWLASANALSGGATAPSSQ